MSIRERGGDCWRYQFKSGAVTHAMCLHELCDGFGTAPWLRLYQAWDRQLGCWVVYQA